MPYPLQKCAPPRRQTLVPQHAAGSSRQQSMSSCNFIRLLLLSALLLTLSITASSARHLQMNGEAFDKVNLDENPASTTVGLYALGKYNGDGVMSRRPQERRDRMIRGGAAEQPSSPVNVSPRVPDYGVNEAPAFDADYAGPRTHPPSHN